MKTKNRLLTESDGPFLAAAVLCENVLVDNDKALSVIRIIDRLTIELGPTDLANVPSKEHPLAVELKLLVILKSGGVAGKYSLAFEMDDPTEETHTFMQKIISLDDEPQGGLNLRTNLTLVVRKPGLHCINVLVDGRVLGRVPFMVVVTRKPQEIAPKPVRKERVRVGK